MNISVFEVVYLHKKPVKSLLLLITSMLVTLTFVSCDWGSAHICLQICIQVGVA